MLSVSTPRAASLTSCLSAALLLVGCQAPGRSHGITNLDVAISEVVGSVVELAWQTDQPGQSWVEFGLDEGRSLTTPVIVDPTGVHRAQLLGLPTLRTVYYEVFTQVGEDLLSEQGEILTEGLPPGFPDIQANAHDASAISDEPYMLVGLIGAENFVAVLDRKGEVLWCMPVPLGVNRMLPMSVDFDPGLDRVVVGNFFMDFITLVAEDQPPSSEALGFGASGGQLETMDLGVAHHELVQLPDGSMATLGIDVRDWYDPDRDEEIPVMGDTLVLVAPDGSRTELFNTWDWREPEVHDRFYQISDDYGDWTHGNGLSYHVESDTFLMSLGLVDTVLEIDGATGDVLREFGPHGYTVPQGVGAAFSYQHGPHWTDEGSLLMSSWVDGQSRVMAIEYSVDDDSESLTKLWSYGENEGFTSIAGGQALRVNNGNTVLNTGYRGLLVEISPDHEPVWEMSSSMGHVFVSLSFFDDFYAR